MAKKKATSKKAAKKKAAGKKPRADANLLGFSQYIEQWLPFIKEWVAKLAVHESYREDAVQDVVIALATGNRWKTTDDKQKLVELIEVVIAQHKKELVPLELEEGLVIILVF